MIDCRSEPVYPHAAKWRADLDARQIAKGLEKYGQPLMTHDGRDTIEDMGEEWTDLGIYMTKAKMERDADKAEIAALKAELAAVQPTIRRLTARVLELTMRVRA
jgi:hypothetical protein